MLQDYFSKIIKLQFVDCDEAYCVRTEICQADIAITKDEVVMNHIFSFAKGGGSDMLNRLEEYSKELGKTFVVSNIISPKLQMMVEKRGYVKEFVPFAPEHGIMDLVEIYKKVELKTYYEWCPILEEESGMKIVDDDGGRQLCNEGKIDELIPKEKALKYFYYCTVCGVVKPQVK